MSNKDNIIDLNSERIKKKDPIPIIDLMDNKAGFLSATLKSYFFFFILERTDRFKDKKSYENFNITDDQIKNIKSLRVSQITLDETISIASQFDVNVEELKLILAKTYHSF